jgi:hypothetical protein
LLKRCCLFMGWEKPIFKCFSHVYAIYIVLHNVNKNNAKAGLYPKSKGLWFYGLKDIE